MEFPPLCSRGGTAAGEGGEGSMDSRRRAIDRARRQEGGEGVTHRRAVACVLCTRLTPRRFRINTSARFVPTCEA